MDFITENIYSDLYTDKQNDIVNKWKQEGYSFVVSGDKNSNIDNCTDIINKLGYSDIDYKVLGFLNRENTLVKLYYFKKNNG